MNLHNKATSAPAWWRKPGLWLVAAVAVVAALGWHFWKGEDTAAVTRATAVVELGDIENLVTATGTLQPRDYVDVGAQVSGQLKTLVVDVGSEVKQGDLLAEIDATLYIASVDASRAQLKNQKAQMREREASLKLTQINYQRQLNLFKAEATTRESLDNAEASLAASRAQIESLSAQIEQTESSLRADEAKLQYASIYAPMDGTVVSISTKQGQTLNANQTAPILMRIADLSTVTVKAQVSEADVGKIKAGMPVYFTTLGSEGRRWYSTLERIEPTPQNLNNVILYNALFDVPNQGRELMSDMTAQVFFVAGEAKNVPTLPVSALTFFPVRDRNVNSAVANQTPRARPEGERRPAADAANSGAANPVAGRPNSERPNAEYSRNERPGGERQAGERQNFAPLAEGERRARLQVQLPDGSLEERVVVVGVSDRVKAQIKSGVSEGDLVVLNTQKAAAARPGGAQQPRGPMGPPGMMR